MPPSRSTAGRIIALGQDAAGDDGAGPAVLEELRRRGADTRAELIRAPHAGALLALLDTPAPVVIVDAAVGGSPGDVLHLRPPELRNATARPLSSHGLGVEEALALALLLDPDRISPSIHIVAIVIAPPRPGDDGLSPAVARAVPRAAGLALRIVAAPPGAPD